jgi:hypothetical protein
MRGSLETKTPEGRETSLKVVPGKLGTLTTGKRSEAEAKPHERRGIIAR